MKRYNDHALCVKCGGSTAASEYEAKIDPPPKGSRQWDMSRPERMRRQCACCKFVWYELPMDSEEVEKDV